MNIPPPEKEQPVAFVIDPNPASKIVYFDIDGTFLDYDDVAKTALRDGVLETALKASKFDYIACVSGWVDIFAEEVMHLKSVQQRKEALHQLLQPLFPDKDWFMEKVVLISDTDHRCSYIDFNVDWYYVDDWADKFFIEAHGEALFQKQIGNRILMCDHQGDGTDILKWLGANSFGSDEKDSSECEEADH